MQEGWMCPKCLRIWSATTEGCKVCNAPREKPKLFVTAEEADAKLLKNIQLME